MFRKIIALLFFVLPASQELSGVYAQSRAVKYEADLFFSSSNEETLPFWLTTNRFGVIDTSSPNGTLRIKAEIPGADLGSFSYDMGVDLVTRAADRSTVFFQQLYGRLRWGPFQFLAGRKERASGEVHPLSLGSMTLSRNAAPVTRISVSWPEFVTVPKTGRFVGVKGYIGHGWIEGNRVVNDAFLHEKNLYIRLGMPDWPVEGRAGIMHYAMWGGKPIREDRGDRLPSSFSDFWRVFFVQGAQEGTLIDGEITNVLGNSLGAYDFSLRVFLQKLDIIAYRQFYLEDTVSLAFRNGWDGLWGLGVDFRDGGLIRSLLWEHVNTKRQSSKKDEPRGTDNYYNHFVYESGWTHRGRTLGMPLMLTASGYEGVVNNILLAHHAGIEGILPRIGIFRVFFTYSRNYGAHSILDADTLIRQENARFEDPVHRYAVMVEGFSTIFPQREVDAYVRIGYDWGGSGLMPANNLGVTLGLRHAGVF